MAARLQPEFERPAEILDLRRLTAQDLEPLLAEEIAAWSQMLEWDFEKSAELVERFVDLHALNGFAAVVDGEVAGYLYYVIEENKGLIGDLYVARDHRGSGYQNQLLAAGLEAIMENPYITRVEAQLMMAEREPGR